MPHPASNQLETPREASSAPPETESRLVDLNDGELLEIFTASSHPDAFSEIVRRHAQMIAGVTRRMLSDIHDAEDAFQATFVVLVRSAKKIRKSTSLASWLYGVAFRTARTLRLKRKRDLDRVNQASQIGVTDLDSMVPSNSLDPLSVLSHQLQLAALDCELSQLPPKLRDAIIEHYLRGVPVPKIADEMNLSISAVEGRLKRGRRILRSKLAMRGMSLSLILIACSKFQEQNIQTSANAWAQTLLTKLVVSDETGGPRRIETSNIETSADISQLIHGELAMKLVPNFGYITVIAILSALTLGYAGFVQVNAGNSPGDESNNSILLSALGDSTASTENDPFSAPDSPVVQVPTAEKTPPPKIDQNVASYDPFGGPVSRETSSANQPQPKIILPNSVTEEVIRSKLDELSQVDFNQKPISAVAKYLQDQFEIPIVIEEAAFRAAKFSPDEPITISMPPTSLRNILMLILEPLDLVYCIRHDTLIITTKEGEKPTIRYYELPQSLQESPELLGSAFKVFGSENSEPKSEDNFQLFGSTLVVKSKENTHYEIDKFLKIMNSKPAKRSNTPAPASKPNKAQR